MPKGYTDVLSVENYILKEIDAAFESQIESWIAAVEKYIDNFTGRDFMASPQASEGDPRYFDGNGSSVLLIDDCLEITSVKVGDEEVTFGEWYLYPANETPKNKIILKGRCFSKGNQNVEITGKWGYSEEVPDDIKLAATVLVAGIIAYADNPGVNSETIGRYSVTYSSNQQWADFKQTMNILDSYRKYSF